MVAIAYIIGLLGIFYILARICDEYFVGSLDIIAKKLKLSEDVAGATFMAVGTSAPEFFTASIALLKIGSEDIGAGTIVGSAIFNILVIVGASAVVATAYLRWQPVVRDMSFYIVAILVLLFTFQDGVITLGETILYLFSYAVYIAVLVNWKRWVPHPVVEKELGEIASTMEKDEQKPRHVMLMPFTFIDRSIACTYPNLRKNPHLYWLTFAVSIVYIIFFSWLLVECGIGLAHELGIPEVIIALTILAGGTSVPDLLGSVIVARQGRGDMAVSNAVGSNTFDILICLGLPWMIYILVKGQNVVVSTENLMSSIFLLWGTVVSMLFILAVRKFKIGRYSGFFLLALYAGYLAYAIYGAYHPDAFSMPSWS